MTKETRPAKIRSTIYWTTTALTAFFFLTGGVAYLVHVDPTMQGMAALGYPAYFVTILGIWKLLGGIVILAPRLPRLKEWAYAGIVFDLTGASISQGAVGHPAIKVIVPLVLLWIAAASWALRPSSRTLGDVTASISARNSRTRPTLTGSAT